ncbi:hypothetical protein D9M68_306590 [compost metagenome]
MGDHPFQSAFQLADVGANTLGDEERGIVRQIDLGLLGFLHQDRDTGFQLRRLHGNRETPTKTGFQALFQALDLLRVAVAGKDHLLAPFEQGVEGVEKLLLRTLLAGEELNVVDQQCVHGTVEALELVDGIQL